MNLVDWLIIIAIIVALIVVIRIIQKITAVIATLVITLILIAVAVYFLYQWDLTNPLLAGFIDESTIGVFFRGAGDWISNTILSWFD